MSTSSTSSHAGRSLAKGPVAIVGLLGIAFGVAGLIFGGHSFSTSNIPHGAVTGTVWLSVMANGWTNLLFIAAGVLLVLGSSMHWGAKTSAFVVAGVLGAAAVIAVIRGNGVFGIFAANHRTEIVWGAAAIVLLLLALLPRVGRRRAVQEPGAREDRVRDDRVRDDRVRDEPRPVAQDELVARRDRTVGDEPVARDEPAVARDDDDRGAVVSDGDRTVRDEQVTREQPVARDETVAPER